MPKFGEEITELMKCQTCDFHVYFGEEIAQIQLDLLGTDERLDLETSWAMRLKHGGMAGSKGLEASLDS